MIEIINYLKQRVCKVTAHDLQSKGTGFFIDENGTLLTNFHVISKISQDGKIFVSKDITLEFNGRTAKGEVQNVTQENAGKLFNYDYCIIKLIDFKDTVSFFNLGSYGMVEEGLAVHFAGFPLTLHNPAFHHGYVSSLRDAPVRSRIGLMKVIDIDATVVKGNSGGPLVIEKEGQFYVVGIISSEVTYITDEFKRLQQFLEMQLTRPESGAVFIAGVNPNAALLEVINTLENNISTGIGTAISIDYVKQDPYFVRK